MKFEKPEMKLAAFKVQLLADEEKFSKTEILQGIVKSAPEAVLLGVEDLTELFSVHPVTIYKWKHRGELPDHIKIGRKLYWRLSDLSDMLKARLAGEYVRLDHS